MGTHYVLLFIFIFFIKGTLLSANDYCINTNPFDILPQASQLREISCSVVPQDFKVFLQEKLSAFQKESDELTIQYKSELKKDFQERNYPNVEKWTMRVFKLEQDIPTLELLLKLPVITEAHVKEFQEKVQAEIQDKTAKKKEIDDLLLKKERYKLEVEYQLKFNKRSLDYEFEIDRAQMRFDFISEILIDWKNNSHCSP